MGEENLGRYRKKIFVKRLLTFDYVFLGSASLGNFQNFINLGAVYIETGLASLPGYPLSEISPCNCFHSKNGRAFI